MSRRTLLVLRALGLGDLLTALPALRALADGFPEHRRVLASPAWLAPLALHAGAADEVLPTVPFEPLARSAAGADVAVNLHGRGPQSHRMLLSARPRRLIAFAHPDVPETAGAPRFVAGEHEVERWCRMLREHGIEADASRLDVDPPARSVPEHAVGATVIHPGAGSAARRWPPERFAAVARAERERGRDVVVTGTRPELAIARRVAHEARLPPRAVLAGRTELLALAAVVGAAARVVTGDTGVAHLATALDTPSVVLFGPVSPARWGPPADRPQHRVLWAGSTGDPHADAPHAGLLKIGVDDVLGELAALDALRAAA